MVSEYRVGRWKGKGGRMVHGMGREVGLRGQGDEEQVGMNALLAN